MPTSMIRVLVADDYEPFRQFLSSAAQNRPDVRIICETSDGVETVEKAAELRPDLILLDIGLPKLNGIEAARQIHRLSPETKILFVSQESSADVVQVALGTGACGYVVKRDAGSELLIALNAVLRGETFVGARFASHEFARVPDEHSFQSFGRAKDRALVQSPAMEATRRHEVQFYSAEAYLLDSLAQFIESALKAGDAAIVLATESHREGLRPILRAKELDISAAIDEGRYIALDAADTLSTFMVNGRPDPHRFSTITGDLITQAMKALCREHARVATCGECAPLLLAQGNAEAAIQVEHLWDEMAKSYELDVLCGYPLSGFQQDSHIFQRICAEHSAAHWR